MSDGAISQDEIDALLSGSSVGGGAAASPSIDLTYLNDFSKKISAALQESVSKMTGATFTAGAPVVETINRDAFLERLPDTVIAVTADFSAGITGDHIAILPVELAQKIIDLVNKEDGADLDAMALSIVSEAVGQHTGSEITELSKGGKVPGLACNPAEAIKTQKAMARCPPGDFVLFSYLLTNVPADTAGDTDVSYTLWEAVSMDAAKAMIAALGGGPKPAPQPAAGGGRAGGQGGGFRTSGANMPNVQGLEYPPLQGGAGLSGEQGNIGLIMDVFMEMTVELGRTKKQIKEILGMGEGTIIELDKLAGEPVDILVNHKAIAKGEVVVIDENFGVRVTEILSPMERMTEMQ
jgi:flagellar motor switch protein FliN/FliY